MSSPLTRSDVEKIAALAHLDLTPKETELFTHQLGQILEFFERLRAVDTTGADDAWRPPSSPSSVRTDTPHPSLTVEEALANAPAPGPGGLFRVPKVIGS